MDSYPGNSHKAKDNEFVDEAPTRDRAKKSSPEVPEKTKKVVEKVVTGTVVRRKKSLGKRFHDTFVAGDAKGVWHYVLLDVMIPAAKDMVADAGREGIERMLFGDSRGSSRRSRGGSNGYVNYGRYASSSSPSSSSRRPPWESEPRREISRRSRATHNFDEIILETRGEAEDVIDRLNDLLSQYEVATVSDLYDMTDITGNYTDDKWGWKDLRGSGVSRTRGGGYLLNLPQPEPLD